MAAANHWQSPIQVGSQHLARSFARLGWQVGYVSDPISPLHVLGGITPDLRDRWSCYRSQGQTDGQCAVWNYVPGAGLTPNNKPLLRSRFVTEHWSVLAYPSVGRVLAKAGFEEVDLLYCDRFTHRSWFSAVRYKRSVYRMSDNNSGFQRHGMAAKALEEKVAREVDLVVYTASTLEERVKAMQPKAMLHLPNGIDTTHFTSKEWTRPIEYMPIKRPIAVYVGSMDAWFDYGLINECVRLLPDVSFVLIGPDQLARKNLRPKDNLHILGRRPHSELPGYLCHADVGLIPFDVSNHRELIRNVNPLKLYEYLACGLPVISTEWEEIQQLKSPATLCCTVEEFVSGIGEALTAPADKIPLQHYAADKDWSHTVQKLLTAMALS
jgi:glycosyltransferase involved in cell wall biosynthesis